jgi:urea carboxylase-associated protein 2
MIVHAETVPGARYWSMVIRRGYVLRIVDPTGRANAATLLFNPRLLSERYNMADTLKAQHTSKLTKGHMLYSDMGRVLMSIVDDTLGWHDAIGGVSTPDDVRRRYGESSYQRDRNAFHRSGRELFLIELGKWGLGRQDLVANVNFFSRVYAGADGALAYAPGHSKPGAHVELRAEMDTLVVLNTAPHPLNPAREYTPGPVELAIRRGDAVRADDYCIGFRPENARAYANTSIYHCQLDDRAVDA